MPKLYTAQEVAKMLHLSADHTRKEMRAGRLPAVKIGRKWYMPEIRLNELIGVSEDETVTR
ncbi:helix-turn-helix domain-containing protein [uncultured Slackia sp.]|uniref:helix-turn-helix domain-containing protein n=1 Tax=uncultured Slackia sp. TaxID=665903 RepID=UPI00258AF8E8|nr:helix-turn-helix domain-containing protein [uncultured Slackia sp.]